MSKINEMDLTFKIIVIILAVVISYLALYLVLNEVLVQDTTSPWSMMPGMPHNGGSTDTVLVNVVSLSIALIAGFLIAFILLKSQKTAPAPAPSQTDELEIIKRALSNDEKAVINEIRKAGEITQDSLRFRLEWSKAKLSRILTNLDKLNIIQRERVGKTYKVFLSEKRPKK